MIFDFSFRERGFLHHRPHDRFRPAIEATVHHELLELGDRCCLRIIGHGEVRIIPVRLDAQTLEPVALHIHPRGGKVATLFAKFKNRHLVLVHALGAVFLFDLPFDRQAMAIPAGHEQRVLSHHLLRANDNVFQDMVQRMAHMDGTIGIRRTIVENEFLSGCALLPQLFVKIKLGPARQHFRLALWQACLHRKGRIGQAQG